ncbi:MAG: hypothetical protein JWN86_1136 [Planctomycetota bacterium]|nr:hypothetical protein [Planctomycetota bacterium]
MAFIPADARWYLADLILEYAIQDEPRNVVHVNLHLIEADSPEAAYEKAMALGQAAQYNYQNTDGKLVRVSFRGLRDLNVIHDGVEDEAELIYEESFGVPEETLGNWVKERDQLGVFLPMAPCKGSPNYMPAEIWSILRDLSHRCDELPKGE